MTTFLSLNEDVVFEICTYLTSMDAFHLALTSSRVYPFALPRALAHCTVPREKTKRRVRRFRKFMSTPEPRLSRRLPIEYVRSLDLRYIRPDIDGIQSLNYVLGCAQGLQSLSLSHAHANLGNERLERPLSILQRLTTLVLEGCGEITVLLVALDFPHAPLENLSLHYTHELADPDLQSFEPAWFIRQLLRFPSLRKLRLYNANSKTLGSQPASFFDTLSAPGFPILPSIRHLDLHVEDHILEALLAACRGLEHLSFHLTHFFTRFGFMSDAGPAWPSPLRSLTWNTDFGYGFEVPLDAAPRLPRARHFILLNALRVQSRTYTVGDDGRGTHEALFVLGHVQPTALTVTVCLASAATDGAAAEAQEDEPTFFWSTLAGEAPRLRWLELTLDVRNAGQDLVPCLLAAVIALPKLVYLGLDVPPSPAISYADDRPFAGQPEIRKKLTFERSVEALRAHTLAHVVHMAAVFLPGLRLLKLAHCRPRIWPETAVPEAETTDDDGMEEKSDRMISALWGIAEGARRDAQWLRADGDEKRRFFPKTSIRK
ncbi:uncharacterized protein BXZ73DRAFT_105734 [Epithele typhae]|uniref:uncharacterized protein n=1 Tax=Epithele typhae TaxID=378194 RepID=UPI0020084E2A|nr:uncharacterized protein BXZ73DRAFT_105734 [Epithele typhae]KAH9916756.1 hypothetical protein BXZ73DRAFT_105734 [Epithele typhae]